MVGFGSSLHMSCCRGWEDAYLDYQSLRLLLTQVEAVYEEEGWEQRGGGRGRFGNDNHVMDPHDLFDFDGEGEEGGPGNGGDENEDAEEDYRPWVGWRGLWRKQPRTMPTTGGRRRTCRAIVATTTKRGLGSYGRLQTWGGQQLGLE